MSRPKFSHTNGTMIQLLKLQGDHQFVASGVFTA